VITRSATATSTVLVVDDDDAVRQLTALALRRAGFAVQEAPNGAAALDLVESEEIGLVVLDMALPGMTGTEVVETLRRQPETATLPVLLITGSGDEHSVLDGLAAGADDFLLKPVRLEELVARVRAHLRSTNLWSARIADQLRARQNVISALGALRPSDDAVETATRVVAELATRIDADVLAVLQLDQHDRLIELATFNRIDGVMRGGSTLPSDAARDLVSRTKEGPWLNAPALLDSAPAAVANADLAITVGAPIYAGERLVGLLTIGLHHGMVPPSRVRQGQLLAAAIDYASVLSAVAGPAFADRRDAHAIQLELKRSLAAREFHPVFQRILEIDTQKVVGYEALTRFDDGAPPGARFAEAWRAGLGSDYELGAIRAAVRASRRLPPGAFLSLNLSPTVLVNDGRRLGQLLKGIKRPVVLELTEHEEIADYAEILAAIAKIGDVSLAVDDAGAGFASLRHILELRPGFVKLDISIVRGIDTDTTRQALCAGLQYFAIRTDFRLIAEGVERQEELEALRVIGVDLAQGYLLGRPRPTG
jgi:EAL domain-containing protein (putative c-di-GMP-specific phosphodiesterase class I)/DNA-binding response OmpR family regulator